MASISRREHRSSVIWPGFVDALATLLMVIIFLLMIFVLAQFFLGQALSGRDKALRELESDLSELAKVLALTKSENEQLQHGVNSLRDQLSASLESRADLEQQLAGLRADYASAQSELSSLRSRSQADKEAIDRQLSEIADLSGDVAALKALKEELEKEVSALSFRASEAESKRDQLAKSLDTIKTERDDLKVGLAEKQEIADTARAQLALMNKQMAALRQQLDQLNAALDAAEAEAKEKNVQIKSLGQRLNAALATKVQELSRYRSEFFGRLRQVIGNREDVRIVGDRFVLQSELLFAKGSAEIGEGGQRELAKLATTLLEIAVTMPGDIDWILSIDGHTDNDPIATAKFPSNWELSTARALSVVHQLIKEGIPAKRLAATGYGEYYPITPGKNEIDKAKNRRIEFKFTQR
ncbi:MAG: peptidoglycan -binding protein [Rhodospirillales bacterium]